VIQGIKFAIRYPHEQMVETGTLLQNRFLIEEQIGRGGMGAVYIATDQKFGSRVAIKERAYEDAELAEAFEREARLLNTLHHPILPHVSDYFSEGGKYFLVMQYIEGEDLSEILKREGAFATEVVVKWALELLDGLDYLHSQDPPIIHRDIKPHNLKLTSRGNIVLLDFGLAKETSGNTLGAKSVFGYSRRYSPLEQIEGVGTDARSDIFSLGATLYNLLTGAPPVDVLARVSSIVAGKGDPLQLASDINRNVPPAIASVIHSALALNAENRFISANAMQAALEFAVSEAQQSEAARPLVNAVAPPIEQAADMGMSERESDRSERGPAPFGPVDDHTSHAYPRPTSSRWLPIYDLLETGNWHRPALWAAATLACLLLITYAIFHSRSTPVNNEEVVGQSLAAEPENVTEQTPSLKSAEKPERNVSEVSSKGKHSRSKAYADATPVDDVDNNSNQPDADAEDLQPPPPLKQSRPQRKRVDQTPEPATTATQPDKRPRVVRTDRYRQPPISTIETIFTGLPSESQRSDARQPRH